MRIGTVDIQEQVALAPLTTFGIGGASRYFATIHNEDQLTEALDWASTANLPVFVLGGGSNLLVRDEGFAGLVLSIEIQGIPHHDLDLVEAGAGVVWDDFVSWMVDLGHAGIECMAGIPGSVGGTPVQNVGAYGQEVSEVIERVRALDLRTGRFVELDKAACRFRYRESLFNVDEPGRYIVTRVWFRLRPGGSPTLKYADLQKRFATQGSENQELPSLAAVATAVREIRRSKGMLLVEGDPDTKSAGSFFKNPVVKTGVLSAIGAAAGVSPEAVPHWPAGADKIKLPAAWLLEKAGFVKGLRDGAVGISTRHTLALVNLGGATFADVERLERRIVATVSEKFGVKLVREPVVLG